ncbi:MAG TPA: TlpA disulfide reductase family protein [Pseudomonadales bacterium]|nr:TlpA disulfide reductase family protein [Pseudomonadales bacterium]
MKRLLLLCMFLAGCQQPADFVDIHGHGHRFSDYAGKWVLVNYWATWCGPCIKEIPELNTLAAQHGDRLVILGVNYDEPKGSKAVAAAEKMKIAFPVLSSDPSKRLGIQVPDVLPTTFVFAPGMKLANTLVGPQTGKSILAALDQPNS